VWLLPHKYTTFMIWCPETWFSAPTRGEGLQIPNYATDHLRQQRSFSTGVCLSTVHLYVRGARRIEGIWTLCILQTCWLVAYSAMLQRCMFARSYYGGELFQAVCFPSVNIICETGLRAERHSDVMFGKCPPMWRSGEQLKELPFNKGFWNLYRDAYSDS
jgi:hypothetical protein